MITPRSVPDHLRPSRLLAPVRAPWGANRPPSSTAQPASHRSIFGCTGCPPGRDLRQDRGDPMPVAFTASATGPGQAVPGGAEFDNHDDLHWAARSHPTAAAARRTAGISPR